MRPIDAGFEQRAGDGHFGGGDRTVLAARGADAHQRRASARHDGLHIGEVQVDQPRRGDEVGDALDTGKEHLIGGLERVQHADVAVGDGQQPVIRDDDEGVNLAAQALDPGLGLNGPALALEAERAGHHADRQRAQRTGYVRDHRSTAGTGAAALPRRDEDHVGALEHLFDLFPVVLGRPAADVGVGSSSQATGELPADVELDVGVAHQQSLRVGVDRDELDALEPLFDHSINGINATAADSYDLDDRQVVLRCCHEEGTFPLVLTRPRSRSPFRPSR